MEPSNSAKSTLSHSSNSLFTTTVLPNPLNYTIKETRMYKYLTTTSNPPA